MKPIWLLLCTCFFSTALLSQTIVEEFEWDGITRSYRVFIPDAYEPGNSSLPLVLNFHGLGSSAFEQQLYSNMNDVANAENFFVVYPQGTSANPGWNVGWNFGTTADDVGFVNALIDTLQAHYGVNLDRVYSCGMSNGGFLSYKLACELNGRIAKIASVTGSMHAPQVDLCMPENPIPVMQIHGTADPVVGYNGTANVSIPIENLIDTWADFNNCQPVTDTIAIEDINTLDLSTAQLIQYRDCEGETIMAFYKIDNGGHTWPGAGIIVGITNQDFNASEEIWAFFNDEYPREQIVSTSTPLESENIHVFPNPFQESFRVYSDGPPIRSVRVFDALGKVIYQSQQINNDVLSLNGSSWNQGFYFIEVQSDKRYEVIKVIKN